MRILINSSKKIYCIYLRVRHIRWTPSINYINIFALTFNTSLEILDWSILTSCTNRMAPFRALDMATTYMGKHKRHKALQKKIGHSTDSQ